LTSGEEFEGDKVGGEAVDFFRPDNILYENIKMRI
jgi:hypothetical protein